MNQSIFTLAYLPIGFWRLPTDEITPGISQHLLLSKLTFSSYNRIRGAYQSYINITYGVGSMLGAALGGAMVDSLGWRWEFGVQVPVLAVGVVVSIIAVPNDIGLYGKKKEGFWEAMRAFDFKGSFLMSTSVTFLILGLVSLARLSLDHLVSPTRFLPCPRRD